MNSWFISWCTYTSSQADGLVVDRYGSCIQEYPEQADPQQVHDDMIIRLKKAQSTDYLHIVGFNRV